MISKRRKRLGWTASRSMPWASGSLVFLLMAIPVETQETVAPSATEPSSLERVEPEAQSRISPEAEIEAAAAFATAKLLVNEGELNEALIAFQQSIELQPNEAYSRIELASFHADLAQMSRSERTRFEHFEAAVEQAEEARRIAPNNLEILSDYAQIHLRHGERDPASLEVARETFELLRAENAGDLQILGSLAQIYVWRQDHRSAVEVLEEALDSHPNHRVLLTMALDSQLASGDSEGAETSLERLLEIQPEQLDKRLQLAELRSERGDHRGALSVLEESSEEIRLDSRVKLVTAREMHFSGDNERALLLTDELLADNMENPTLARLRVGILSGLARYHEALIEFEPLVVQDQSDPRYPQDTIMVAKLLERIGRSEEAIRRLNDAVDELDGLQVGLLLSFAGTLERNGQHRRAVRTLEDFAQVAWRSETYPEYGLLLRATSEVLQRGEILEEAGDILRTGSQELRGKGQSTLAQGLDLQRLGLLVFSEDWSRGRELAEALVASEVPEIRVAATHQLARILASSGRLEQAVELIDGATELSQIQALSAKINLLFETDADPAALELLEQMVETGTAENLFAAARLLQGAERYPDMIPVLERLIILEPESPPALFSLGVALERSGKISEAESVFARLLDSNPDYAPALNYLGYLWADQGNHLGEALDLIHRAVALDPDNGAYVDSLGWVYFRLGHFERARGHLEWAARLVPDDATIFEHLGDLYRSLNDVERARDSYQQALSLSGDNPDTVRNKLRALDRTEPSNPSL